MPDLIDVLFLFPAAVGLCRCPGGVEPEPVVALGDRDDPAPRLLKQNLKH